MNNKSRRLLSLIMVIVILAAMGAAGFAEAIPNESAAAEEPAAAL